jgi:peptidoglycan hydrolase CwlO-like protein
MKKIIPVIVCLFVLAGCETYKRMRNAIETNESKISSIDSEVEKLRLEIESLTNLIGKVQAEMKIETV